MRLDLRPRLSPAETHNLRSLHTILSTSSPLQAQSYEYVYSCIKRDVLLGSISGAAPECCRRAGPGSPLTL